MWRMCGINLKQWWSWRLGAQRYICVMALIYSPVDKNQTSWNAFRCFEKLMRQLSNRLENGWFSIIRLHQKHSRDNISLEIATMCVFERSVHAVYPLSERWVMKLSCSRKQPGGENKTVIEILWGGISGIHICSRIPFVLRNTAVQMQWPLASVLVNGSLHFRFFIAVQ